jgi:hypothetical protein
MNFVWFMGGKQGNFGDFWVSMGRNNGLAQLQRNIRDCNVSTSIVHIQGAVKCLLHYFVFDERYNIEEEFK